MAEIQEVLLFVSSIVALPANGGDYPGEIHRHRVDEPRPFGLTKPIPYGETVKFMNLAGNTILVSWNNFLRLVAISHQLARTTASQFKIMDRGNGRIAIQSVIGGSFVTVSESGRMSEVRIQKNDEGDASTFRWEDMMRGDLMLMSLQTHWYLFVDPFAGSLCSADCRGPRPDRRDGSCFSWTYAGNQK